MKQYKSSLSHGKDIVSFYVNSVKFLLAAVSGSTEIVVKVSIVTQLFKKCGTDFILCFDSVVILEV